MAERPDASRYSRPIVPDPDASLSAPRWRQPPPPRVWPLWLLVVLLIAAGAALGWAGWQERTRLQAELSRVSGELSNVHARFDADEGRGEAFATLQDRMDELANLEAELDAVIDERLATFESEQERRLTPLEEVVMSLEESMTSLDDRLAAISDENDTQAAILAATRTSLDALERAGEEGRAALQERLAALDEAREAEAERLRALATTLETLEGRFADQRGAQAARIASLEVALSSLEADVEAMAGSRDDAQERIEALGNRLGDIESGLRELRQAQLAMSAQLEVLRQ
ncbi:hypothetical protein [Halomonas daqiaonensis]|uniref:Uncharacterized protein n=1 Tax=Halomonas daqiaonensis TaxID=650850 RepID=A0A1H7FN19_9GAMM|nr:hypothetical protein [Halomonas daqiaonensis]SEK24735.1 hypothetical protein SAMN04488129_101113 [Halomonas daqiaonensis]